MSTPYAPSAPVLRITGTGSLQALCTHALAFDQRLVEQHCDQFGPPLAGGVDSGLAGHTIGAYTLERPLGMGGMGTVWLARRSDGRFAGHVALKLVNLAVLDVRSLSGEQFRS